VAATFEASPALADGALLEAVRPRERGRREIVRSTRLLGVGARAPHLLARRGTHVCDAVAGAAELIASGAIVAVKGLRRYHLACRPDQWAPVRALRTRKRCEDERPFALMAADLNAARRLVAIGRDQADLLQSAARPVVMGHRRASSAVAPAVAPGRRELGVLLPYTPLQQLLLSDVGELGVEALVMTGGTTPSSEPSYREDDEALARVRAIADAFLVHDGPFELTASSLWAAA
jgi:hydrogenase maturation protein HypF